MVPCYQQHAMTKTETKCSDAKSNMTSSYAEFMSEPQNLCETLCETLLPK